MAAISGDSVFSHACLGASDLTKSAAFYDAVLTSLGVKNLGPFGDSAILYGKDKPAFLVLKPGNGEAPSSNGLTVDFAAPSEGEAGPRGHLPGAYAAYLHHPAGNKICAYHFTAE